MMIPLRAELRIAYKPVVTYAIVILCIIIYAFQYNNEREIQKSAISYCSGLKHFKTEIKELDFISRYPSACVNWISFYYGLADKKYIHHFFKTDYKNFKIFSDKYTPEKYYATLRILQNHIEDFGTYAPINLDGALMYDPSTLNPITMVTSVLSHGSFLHIFFNLVFFLAFAPALEALVGNTKNFIAVILIMIVGTNLVYAMAMMSSAYPTPTLGLSGIVSGMIGFAASFMPKAKIKTFYYVMVLPTPVWLLATYYIGWDMYDLYSRTDHGGVNVVVHVAGGVIGVLMMFFFRKRHKEVNEELQDEIEYMNNQWTTLGDKAESKRETTLKESIHENKMKEVDFLEQLHRLVRVDNHSAVINMVIGEYDPLHSTVERYEYIFDEMKKWKTGRAYECIGRFVIDLRLKQHNSAAALRAAKTIYEVKGHILLADPAHVLILAQAAKEINEYELSYAIVQSADKRYWGQCEGEIYLLLEIELLHLYLNKSSAALKILKSVIDDASHPHRNTVVKYAKQIGLIGDSQNGKS